MTIHFPNFISCINWTKVLTNRPLENCFGVGDQENTKICCLIVRFSFVLCNSLVWCILFYCDEKVIEVRAESVLLHKFCSNNII